VATFADGKIDAFVGSIELGAADNLEAVIVDFIAGQGAPSTSPCRSSILSPSRRRSSMPAGAGSTSTSSLSRTIYESDLKGSPPDLPEPKPGETPEQALFRTQWLEDRRWSRSEDNFALAADAREDVERYAAPC
jgi:hypothetical protein